MIVTIESLQTAFELWEQGFRVDPAAYRTHEECAVLPVSQLSAERADYFMELLNQQPVCGATAETKKADA